jgi:formate dehydrogenase (NADP+) alpha subunit
VAENFRSLKGGRFACFSSAKCTNEENYLIQKFTRAVMGTNNIDHCARLCHAPSVAGLAQSLGSGAMTNSIGEIGGARTIFAIGTNTTWAHPVLALQIKKAVRNGGTLIVANPKGSICAAMPEYSFSTAGHRCGTYDGNDKGDSG